MISALDDPLAIALKQIVLDESRTEDEQKGRSGSGKSGRTWKRGKRTRGKHGAAEAPAAVTPATEGGEAETEAGTEVSPRQALESAALALLVREVVPLVRAIPVEELLRVLSAADVTTAAARISALLTEGLTAKAPATEAMRAWLESARRKRELLAEAGGGLSAQEVAEIRDVSRQAVDRARREDRLLAVPLGAGNWRFPAMQFDENGNPLPGLETVLKAFRVEDPWMRLSELLAPDPELEDRSIFSALREEGEAAIPAAVAAAREVG
jgi:hypothetical protein